MKKNVYTLAIVYFTCMAVMGVAICMKCMIQTQTFQNVCKLIGVSDLHYCSLISLQ